MRIESIFAENLFAFHYDDETENEYERLMNLWTDVNYLYAFAKRNDISDVRSFTEDVLAYAEEIQDTLEEISRNQHPLEYYFERLDFSEEHRCLALQKGKRPRNRLRLYAIRIDENCFVITGGAIKMSLRMDGHPGTALELVKLNNAREFFKQNGVFDVDSFFELLKENDHE